MDLALAPVAPGGSDRLRDVRAWWRIRRPGPSLGKRLDLLYTIAITTGILGALAYGTASSALAQVVNPGWLARYGPSVALAGLFATARWGGYQGPVVFSVPDVAHLLGAPLPRRGLAVGRLRTCLGAGAVAGAIVAGIVIVGLAGEGRGIATGRAAGMAVGLAALGVLGVAAAWGVERSARWDRATARMLWPLAVVAAALAVVAGAGRVGREVALWAGPWGWAVQPGTSASSAAWVAALVLLAAVTAVAAGAALRGCGDCPAERHMVRAEARANALASLMSFDARSARLALETAGGHAAARRSRGLRGLRGLIGARAAPGSTAMIVWRDVVAVRRTPGRALEGAVLAAAGAALALANADRAVTVGVGMLLVYLGAARLLWPLRAELDRPARARVLLRPRLGRVIATHVIVPALAVTAAVAVGAGVVAAAGGLPSNGGLATLLAVAVAPVVTACAAMSARRGGRLPESVFAGASAGDPSGGGFLIVMWLAVWPGLGAVLGAAGVLAVVHGGSGAAVPALAGAVLVGGVLSSTLRTDPGDA